MVIGDLAEELLIAPHSAAELADRLIRAGLLARSESPQDRRRVELALTAQGEAVLQSLSAAHLRELREIGPLLTGLLRSIEKDGATGTE